MDRFNSLLVFFLLLSLFAVSAVRAIVSPADHDVRVRNSTTTTTTANSEEDNLDLLKHAEHHFTNFVKKYEKNYADEEEHAYRLSVFKSNLRRAKRHQNLDPTAVHGITQFSDLTQMEFRRNLLGGFGVKLLEKKVGLEAPILPTNDLPADFDWRDRGVVTPVKNQGNCASSYAFSALGAIEGACALATGKQLDLSEQEVIDCSYFYILGPNYGRKVNKGCGGGRINYAVEHVRSVGFVSELDYPYTPENSGLKYCDIHVRTSSTPKVANFSVVNPNNEDQIAANLVKNGPLAVAVAINVKYMSTYVGGVSCPLICPFELLNYQAVVLVGYGAGAYSPIRLKKEPYWIFKNSWGTSWGDKGYYKICRGKDDACGGMVQVTTVSIATTSS